MVCTGGALLAAHEDRTLADTPATKPTNATTPPDGGAAPERRSVVLLMIVVVAALSVGLFAVLWYRSWWKVPATPNAQLIVEGGEEHAGVVVRVEGKRLAQPLVVTLRKEENYVAFFALPSGTYSVEITRDGRPYLRDPMIHLPEYHRMLVPLKKFDEENERRRQNAASRPV